MSADACGRCGAQAEMMLSNIENKEIVSRLYCKACWLVEREHADFMMEGAIIWARSWPEVERWLEIFLPIANERSNPDGWRRLLAYELRSQLPHLPAEMPPSVARFLKEVDDTAD